MLRRRSIVLLVVVQVLNYQLLPAGGFVGAPLRSVGPAARVTHARRHEHLKGHSSLLMMGKAEDQAFPVLSRIAGGTWQGEMRYAGPGFEAAAFVLKGSTKCVLEGRCVMLESSITFPNGKTRTVVMQGRKQENGTSFRMDPLDAAGPIYMRLAEFAPDTILLQEFNKTDSRVVLTSSISLVQGGEELVQVAHETADDPAQGAPTEGTQIWRMRRHA